MKYYRLLVFISVIAISCGGNNKTSKQSNYTKDETVNEYKWYSPLSDHEGKNITVHGFIWMDTITPWLPKGEYTIYERPNCYGCGEIKTIAKTDISMVFIDDTSITSSSAGQWRLVKMTGQIEGYSAANIERMELSEYSYPDYENSGYIKLTDDLFDNPESNYVPVYIDGYIQPTTFHMVNRYLELELTSTGLKKQIHLYVKEGKGPNQIPLPPGKYTTADMKIKDKNGNPVEQKKVRLFGIFNNDLEPGSNLYVEMIEVIK